MKFNSTIALTVGLLVMMSGAGVATGFWGYSLGHEALKGVTQPDVSPSKKLTQNNAGEDGQEEELQILLSEEELIEQATAIMNGEVDPPTVEADGEKGENGKETGTNQNQGTQLVSVNKEALPVKGEDAGVMMEVVDSAQEDGSLLLKVNLKNEGSEQVRFLYSFLEVRDDQGRALSAITDGLPGELPANGKAFSGTVKIPTALLSDSEELSITLTDYPDRQLELRLSEIPIVR
ncbi:hypothetical protein PN462_20175 [Spirulina sp. CS-785/01]|uniref:hypothetical protein n=1 Tax=Spirulina sp. CS-785/01 TaxID=3021716 RepID=UPI00232C87F0|nr:hypothetical protein [Spirulina sp. CS-785/01]MDB9315443.1 hypothetical protein [Spirulina sp. CS-785/01]